MNSTLLISLGDVAGIGPEVVVKALAQWKIPLGLTVKIIGEKWIIDNEAKRLGLNLPASVLVESLGLLAPSDFHLGHVQATTGNAAYQYFFHTASRCLAGEAQALATAPLSKEAMNLAGHHFVGHTDILDRLTGNKGLVMALWHPKLVVSHVTDHLSLRAALDAITPDRLEQVIRLTWQALVKAGRTRPDGKPAIALAGVNPHAGEKGLFGREEIEILIPTMQKLKQMGMETFGPYAGDTVFLQGLRGRYDAVIAMYHDQGFGPMKTIGFADGVNCTLGLPFVRTSPDHGTAFEIAGKNQAEPESMLASLKLAAQLLGYSS